MTRLAVQCNPPPHRRGREPGDFLARLVAPVVFEHLMSDTKTIVDWAVHWEKQTPDRLHFIQPLGGGSANVGTWTFGQAVREARRMAAYLRSLKLPSKSRIAICSKNCAHWILADWAIWMADHVSVPLYPNLNSGTVRYILEHSDARLLFVGKL